MDNLASVTMLTLRRFCIDHLALECSLTASQISCFDILRLAGFPAGVWFVFGSIPTTAARSMTEPLCENGSNFNPLAPSHTARSPVISQHTPVEGMIQDSKTENPIVDDGSSAAAVLKHGPYCVAYQGPRPGGGLASSSAPFRAAM